MLQTICRRITRKPGSFPKGRAWAPVIRERQAEALATLTDEGVCIESAVLEPASDGDDLLDSLRVESLSKASAVVVQSTHERGKDHRQCPQEAWERSTTLAWRIDLAGPQGGAAV